MMESVTPAAQSPQPEDDAVRHPKPRPDASMERLQAAEEALAHKSAALADVGDMLQRQAAEIVALERQCWDLRAQAVARQAAVAEMAKALADRSEMENLERIIRARDEGIAFLQGEVAEKLDRIQRLEKEVARAQKASAKLAKQMEKLRKENEKVTKQLQKSKAGKLSNLLRRLRALMHPKRSLGAIGIGRPETSPVPVGPAACPSCAASGKPNATEVHQPVTPQQSSL